MIKYKRVMLSLLLSIVIFISEGQVTKRVGSYDGITYAGASVEEIPFAPKKTLGSTYLFEDWFQADILITGDKIIENVPVKYDVKNNVVDISYKGQVRVLPVDRIKKLKIYRKIETLELVNPKIYGQSNIPQLLEVLYSGDYSLFKKYEVELKRANYVPALDAGTRNDELVLQESYYYAKGETIRPLPTGRKKIIRVIAEDKGTLKSFIKSKNLNMKDEKDLITVFQYVNTQID